MGITRCTTRGPGANATLPLAFVQLAFVLLVLIAGCSGSGERKPWNLQPGAWWLYEVRRETVASADRQREWQRNERRITAPDGAPALLRSHGGGGRELLRETAAGLERLAWSRRSADGPGSLAALARDAVLLVPRLSGDGGGWERLDRTRVLERKVDAYGRLFVIDEGFTMAWTRLPGKESVRTPAGEFADCTRLEGRGDGSFEGDRTVSGSRFTVHEVQWHAPGVGLVRLEREERTDGAIIPLGRYLLELIASGTD